MSGLEGVVVFGIGASAVLAFVVLRWVCHRLIDAWSRRQVRRERAAWRRRYGRGLGIHSTRKLAQDEDHRR